MHKIIFTTLAFILYGSALYAQFPAGPSTKTELGRETSQNQYLIYQGSGTPTYTPSGINNAYTYVDTLTNTIYLYSRTESAWRSLADSLTINNRVDSVLIDVTEIKFDTSFNNTDFAAGEIGWGENDEFRMGVLDNYSFAVGQDIYKQAHNTTASTINAGTAVMMTGADGNSSVFTIAPMNYPTIGVEFLIGIVAVDIPAGGYGIVVQNGYVRGLDIDAEGWNAGDVLYLDEVSAGGLTTTPGGVLVAAVTKAGTNGSIYVRPDFYAALSKAETDAVGAMVSGNTETLIDVTYQADSTIDFVVNDDLSLYDNTTSGFLTAEVDGSVTNEIQDLSLSGNTLSLTGDPTTVDLSSIGGVWTIDGTNIYSDISTSLDSATYSFAAGTSAGSDRDMDLQNAIGGFAGQYNIGRAQNAIGYFAGQNNTADYQNAFGYFAGQNNASIYQNAFGYSAGQNNTAESQNAFGFGAGQYNTGSSQNAFGYLAGRNNNSQSQNAFGRQSGQNNTGSYQNAFGYESGRSNTGDDQNAFGRNAGEVNTGFLQNAFGAQAGRYNQGNYNISIGYQAGYSVNVNTTPLGSAAGDFNTWLNYRAGFSITEGDHNIGIGYDALYDLTTGDNNIAFGRDAGNGLTTQTNTIAIGRSAIPGASGEIRIGNSTYYSNTVFPQKITAQSVANDNTATKIAGLNASDEIVYRDASTLINDADADATNEIQNIDNVLSQGGSLTANRTLDVSLFTYQVGGSYSALKAEDDNFIIQTYNTSLDYADIENNDATITLRHRLTGDTGADQDYVDLDATSLRLEHRNEVTIDAPVVEINGAAFGINTVEIDNTSTSVATSLDDYSELHLAVAATTTSIVVTLPNPSADMVGKKIKIFNFIASTNDVDYAISSGNFFSAGVLATTYTATTDGRIDELTCIPDPQSGGYVWAVEQN